VNAGGKLTPGLGAFNEQHAHIDSPSWSACTLDLHRFEQQPNCSAVKSAASKASPIISKPNIVFLLRRRILAERRIATRVSDDVPGITKTLIVSVRRYQMLLAGDPLSESAG
jgi:hypothetical protein